MWLKGKKSPILKAIDADAKRAARQPLEQDHGFRHGKVARSKTKGTRTSAVLFPAAGQDAIIHVYRTNIVGSVDKIDFDLYEESNRTFSRKFRAYSDARIAGLLHRGHCYRIRFNRDPNYPQIEEVVEEIPKDQL